MEALQVSLRGWFCWHSTLLQLCFCQHTEYVRIHSWPHHQQRKPTDLTEVIQSKEVLTHTSGVKRFKVYDLHTWMIHQWTSQSASEHNTQKWKQTWCLWSVKKKLKKIQWQRSLAERKSEQLMDPKTITFFTFHPKLLPLLHPDNQDHKLQIEEHLEFVFLSLAALWLVCFTAFA